MGKSLFVIGLIAFAGSTYFMNAQAAVYCNRTLCKDGETCVNNKCTTPINRLSNNVTIAPRPIPLIYCAGDTSIAVPQIVPGGGGTPMTVEQCDRLDLCTKAGGCAQK